jgi:hypothetical protein
MTPHRVLRLTAAAALLAAMGCVTLTPEESCTAICDEFSTCGIVVSGSSLTGGSTCEADCLGKISTYGGSCKTSAAYLADCFQTYSCTGNDFGCSTNAQSFSEDCH